MKALLAEILAARRGVTCSPALNWCCSLAGVWPLFTGPVDGSSGTAPIYRVVGSLAYRWVLGPACPGLGLCASFKLMICSPPAFLLTFEAGRTELNSG